MELNPYLTFDGNCREALDFYGEVFGSPPTDVTTFGDMPEADQQWVTDENRGRIAHGRVQIGSTTLMASDMGGPQPHRGFSGFTLQTAFGDLDEARAVFGRLSEGGEVQMPFEETFWAAGFGLCTDRFGVGWMVNVDKS